MILNGTYHTLTVARVSDHGLYLTDGDAEVLLPNRYVSLEDKVGDEKEVFVYNDSEDRPVATTLRPLAAVGEVAFLKVVDKTVHGAFLDWGLEAKDIFLPNRNMVGKVEPGQKVVVYLYNDKLSGRAVATMLLREHIRNDGLTLKKGDKVEIIAALRTERGFRVVIDNRYWGMVYDNQLFTPLALGDRTVGYVRKVTEDNRVDVSLQREGYDEVQDSVGRLYKMLRDAGGHLPVHDGCDPAEVSRVTGMSKKVFKRTAGYMMKRGAITMDESGIKLIEKQ